MNERHAVAVVQPAVQLTASEREALERGLASMAAKEARVKQHRKVHRLIRQLARESGAERIDLIYPDQITARGRANFTWEHPQHSACTHNTLGEVVAVKPDGAKFALCKNCNVLKPLRPSTKRRHLRAV